MILLKRLNVEKQVESEEEAVALERKGFERIELETEAETEAKGKSKKPPESGE